MVLLDTHVLIWVVSASRKLSRKAWEAIQAARQSSNVAIADISVWELAWLAENNRIQISGTVEATIREATAKMVIKPITPEVAAFAARLPARYPKDPADRLIGATAIIEGAFLVTADQHIRNAQVVPTIW